MKKLICMMLAVLLAVGCAGSFAESKDENEKTAFLQIKEGVTATVAAAAGDTEGIDTLESGRFCGLIEEAEQGETLLLGQRFPHFWAKQFSCDVRDVGILRLQE